MKDETTENDIDIYEVFDDVIDTLNRIIEYEGHNTVKDVVESMGSIIVDLHRVSLKLIKEKDKDEFI